MTGLNERDIGRGAQTFLHNFNGCFLIHSWIGLQKEAILVFGWCRSIVLFDDGLSLERELLDA
jgi:hypothetical protein